MSTPTLTEKEIKCLANAWQCMNETPKIDYKKLAALCGYTEGSAVVIFGKIKKKLNDMQANPGEVTPKTPSSASRKRKTPTKTTEADGEDDNEATPSKKTTARKSRAKPKVKKEESPVEEATNAEDTGFLSGLEDYGDPAVLDSVV